MQKNDAWDTLEIGPPQEDCAWGALEQKDDVWGVLEVDPP